MYIWYNLQNMMQTVLTNVALSGTVMLFSSFGADFHGTNWSNPGLWDGAAGSILFLRNFIIKQSKTMPITDEATSFTPLKTVGIGGPVELIPEKN